MRNLRLAIVSLVGGALVLILAGTALAASPHASSNCQTTSPALLKRNKPWTDWCDSEPPLKDAILRFTKKK